MNQPTINSFFREHADAYRSRHPNMGLAERKALRSITSCRTEELGGRIEVCDACGHTVEFYNSCRNRHCPLCQNMKKEQWILDRKKEVLPFTYFHIVFTLPDKLNGIVFRNKRAVFNLMFSTCKKTLLSVCTDEKYFGADIGFFSILHTWGQQLNPHPHLHCVVPGGGFSQKKQKWIQAPDNYLVPVRVLMTRFRYLFLNGIRERYRSGELSMAGTGLENTVKFQTMIDSLFRADWVVYLKESFRNSNSVIEYLARYTHRIAISNHRVISADNDSITFSFRDYRDGNAMKTKRMDALSFMRRFMLHIVPYRFVRIRYFGILSHRNKKTAIEACREFFGVEKPAPQGIRAWRDLFRLTTGSDLDRCPVCPTGKMAVIGSVTPARRRAPPEANAYYPFK